MPILLCFGDSLTQRGFEVENLGWVASLTDKYQRRVDIINRGYSGYNSAWLCRISTAIIEETRPFMSILFVGANDSVLPLNSHQHVPLDQYRENLTKLIKQLEKQGPLLVVTPPPCNEVQWSEYQKSRGKPMDRSLQSTRLYRNECLKVSRQLNVNVLDTWKLFDADDQVDGQYFNDGVHFSAKGNNVIFHAISEILDKYIPREQQYALETNVKFLPDSIFCFGNADTIDNSWMHRLADIYIRKADLINRISADFDLKQLSNMLPVESSPFKPILSILVINLNCTNEVPDSQFWMKIIKLLLDACKRVIVITTEENGTPQFKAANDVILATTANLGVPLLNWSFVSKQDSFKQEPFISLINLVRKHWPEISPDQDGPLKTKYPWWNEIQVGINI